MKRQIVTLACTLVLLLAACKTEESHIPAGKMKQVLLDIHIAESWSSMCVTDSLKQHPSREKNMDSLAVYYNSILKHYNITSDEFQSSMQWYQHHPDELDSVYANIIPELSKLEGLSQAAKK
ncbi:DUF4296 domain-containing protein [Chitinophagaceae bacterium MMS25-I14]